MSFAGGADVFISVKHGVDIDRAYGLPARGCNTGFEDRQSAEVAECERVGLVEEADGFDVSVMT